MSTESKADNTPDLSDAAAEAEADKAFLAGAAKRYGEEESPIVEPKTKAEEPPVEVKDDPAPADPTDPYAGLPDGVREALASIPKLEHQARSLEHMARSAEGRYAATLRQVDTLSKEVAALKTVPATPAAPPQKSQDRTTVERELPEVSNLMDELEGRIKAQLEKVTTPPKLAEPTPEPAVPAAPASDARSEDEKLLDDLQPEWRGKFAGTDFNAWLATQPAPYREQVSSTDKAAIVVAALGKFDLSRVRSPAAPDPITTQRQARTAAAAVPTSSARPVAARTTHEMSEEEAFAAGAARAGRRSTA